MTRAPLRPLYWQDVRHESIIATGLLMAPRGIGTALALPLAGKLIDHGGGPPALFGVIITILTAIPFGLIGAHTSVAWLSVASLLRGTGLGFALRAKRSATALPSGDPLADAAAAGAGAA